MPYYGTILDENVHVKKDYKVKNVIPYKFLVLGLILAVGVFMTALSWNYSIVETLKYVFREKGAQIGSGKGIGIIWLYTVVITSIMLIILFFFRKEVPGDSFDNDELLSFYQE